MDDTKLTVSIGVAPTRLLAKMASEQNKPDGKFILMKNKELVEKFLDSKKISKIPGVGPRTQHIFNGLGIKSIKDLRDNLYIIFITQKPKLYQSMLRKSIGYS